MEHELGKLTSLTQWCNTLRDVLEKCTNSIERTAGDTDVDGYFSRLREARQGLVKRWRRQKAQQKVEDQDWRGHS
ncbi:hypothetical protein HPB48_009406 [Haemaphysalis longicornis]|uniref:Uncharacterized protein n=1 Tax=Haemaphysalis longicornis TaxID=44386 RepID=A0A9J6GMZ6_HAELO|nr:hypothetical protein HPB48_009406 [Haemaphysalis longicornis]